MTTTDHFLSLSEALTGFDRAQLLGTGLARTNADMLTEVLGEDLALELWEIAARLGELSGAELDQAVRHEVLGTAKFGPVARRLIQLWYLGMWFELPLAWQQQFRISPADRTAFTSASGYREALVWRVMRTHPPGAKQPGFRSWSLLPLTSSRGADPAADEETVRDD